MIRKVNLAEKFEGFHETWSPRIVGRLNAQHVKIARLKGEFVWHKHDDADELFLVLKGRIRIQLRGDTDLDLEEGELAIVPRGVEHRPAADEEAWVMLFEPAGTLNTGDAGGDLTVDQPQWL